MIKKGLKLKNIFKFSELKSSLITFPQWTLPIRQTVFKSTEKYQVKND